MELGGAAESGGCFGRRMWRKWRTRTVSGKERREWKIVNKRCIVCSDEK
jgi:hypothetical protein